MYATPKQPARDLIPTDWSLDAIRSVRDALQSLPADRLIDARDELAVKLSEAVGGLLHPSARTLLDGGPDFEVTADDDDPVAWLCWTPIEVLAEQLPSLSGGSPEAYQPTRDDLDSYSTWLDHIEAIHDGIDEPEPDRFTEADARAAGLAV